MKLWRKVADFCGDLQNVAGATALMTGGAYAAYHFLNPNIGKEFFTVHGRAVILEKSDTEATHNSVVSPWATVYGNVEIDDSKAARYFWKFRVVQPGIIYFGIDSSGKQFFDANIGGDGWRRPNQNPWYAVCWVVNGAKEWNSILKRWSVLQANDYGERMYYGKTAERHKKYGIGIDEGDEITMEINARNATMKYYINGKDQGNAFTYKKILGKYHMTVGSCCC